ncbi:methyltransferase domain-containing protein, partial [bacterium]|nr:methyltransferase domain-containing protein [bacterium]
SQDVSLKEDLSNQKVIEMVMRRAKGLSQTENRPILACPDIPENEIYRELAQKHDCDIYFGSNDNVLDRLMAACKQQEGDRIAWFQGIHYFLHAPLMDRLLQYAEDGHLDYVRCPDASCKFMLGQSIMLQSLEKAFSLISELEGESSSFFRARPFAFMRTRPKDFKIGFFDELPKYGEKELEGMQEVGRKIYLEERAVHTEKGRPVGDISAGRYKNILEYLPQKGQFVDIACGTGYGCKIMDNDQREIIGVDVSEESVEFAKSHNAKHAKYLIGDAENIPIDDSSTDCVVSIGTIEHVENDGKFVEEIFRILKPDGVAIIYTPQNRLDHKPIWPWHYREYSISSMKKVMKDILSVEKIVGWQNGVISEDKPQGDGMFVVARKTVTKIQI